MYRLNHFQEHSSVIGSAFTLLFTPPSSATFFILQHSNPNPLRLAPLPLPEALATTILLSVPVTVSTLGTPCQWNHTIMSFVQAYFPFHSVLKVRSCCM